MQNPKIEWKNSRGPVVQYIFVEEASWKMRELLNQFPFFFDDDYWYWKVKDIVIKRAPLWMYPQKSIPAEKYHKCLKDGQIKLVFTN